MVEQLKKYFVPIEESIKLRDLGLDEECVGRWGLTSKDLFTNRPFKNSEELMLNGEFCNDLVAAPLWSQVFDWFKLKYKLDARFNQTSQKYFSCKIVEGVQYEVTVYISNLLNSEQIKMNTLNKLIELVNNKK